MKYSESNRTFQMQEKDGVKGLSMWYLRGTHRFVPIEDMMLAREVGLALQAAYAQGRRDKLKEVLRP